MTIIQSIDLYDSPNERNYCERCGKRLGAGIHTCTPPSDTTDRIAELEADVSRQKESIVASWARQRELEAALDVALEALERSAVKHPQQIPQRDAAIAKLKEVRK